MLGTLLVIFVVFFLLMQRTAPKGQPTERQRRRSASEADQLLVQAESKMLLGQETEAMILFERAYWKADEAKQTLFASEAMYGLARIQLKRRQFGPAVAYLERALELEKTWGELKPEFSRLLKSELESARKQLESQPQ